MAYILFKSIIYPLFESVLKHGMVKSKIFGKLLLNPSFGQGSYLVSDSIKLVLLQTSLRFEIAIFIHLKILLNLPLLPHKRNN